MRIERPVRSDSVDTILVLVTAPVILGTFVMVQTRGEFSQLQSAHRNIKVNKAGLFMA